MAGAKTSMLKWLEVRIFVGIITIHITHSGVTWSRLDARSSSVGLFRSLELDFESLHSDLEAIHRLYRRLSTRLVVVAYEPCTNQYRCITTRITVILINV